MAHCSNFPIRIYRLPVRMFEFLFPAWYHILSGIVNILIPKKNILYEFFDIGSCVVN
jgi:hypothetical protein